LTALKPSNETVSPGNREQEFLGLMTDEHDLSPHCQGGIGIGMTDEHDLSPHCQGGIGIGMTDEHDLPPHCQGGIGIGMTDEHDLPPHSAGAPSATELSFQPAFALREANS